VPSAPLGEGGTVQALADALFTDYLLPLELVGVLLLIGMIAVVVLAKKREEYR
jgi:NADH:ubiquinone oxidoreductase subunit 6 (subunit J)